MKLDLVGSLARLLPKTNLFFRQNAPQILVIGGVVGATVTTVLACSATLKAQDVLEEAESEREDIRENPDQLEEDEVKRELIRSYLYTGRDLAVLYLPSVGLGILSIAAILGGHRILTRRNAALAAAYSTLDAAFKDYRKRVVAKFGEDAERAIRYNLSEQTIEETRTDENGKTKKVKVKALVPGVGGVSGYARLFTKYDPQDKDRGSLGWDKSDLHSNFFIKSQEDYLNHRLQANGYIFLNTVYNELGFTDTLAGQSVGWVYDKERPEGDNHIQITRIPVQIPDGEGGFEPAIVLDFNVDGNILGHAHARGMIN